MQTEPIVHFLVYPLLTRTTNFMNTLPHLYKSENKLIRTALPVIYYDMTVILIPQKYIQSQIAVRLAYN